MDLAAGSMSRDTITLSRGGLARFEHGPIALALDYPATVISCEPGRYRDAWCDGERSYRRDAVSAQKIYDARARFADGAWAQFDSYSETERDAFVAAMRARVGVAA